MTSLEIAAVTSQLSKQARNWTQYVSVYPEHFERCSDLWLRAFKMPRIGADVLGSISVGDVIYKHLFKVAAFLLKY